MAILLHYLLLLIVPRGFSIWPPAYKVNLSHEEVFVISETFGSDDNDNIDEEDDEMIHKKDIEPFQLEKDSAKYFRLHQTVVRKNRKANLPSWKKANYTKFKEINFDEEEPIPWKAGYVNKNGNFIQNVNKNVYSSNEMVKSILENKVDIKREQIINVTNMKNDQDSQYDYGSLQANYKQELKDAQKSNSTLNFKETKDEETLKEAVDAAVDFKKEPRNCTVEEKRGIGFGAVECYWFDLKKPQNGETKSRMFRRMVKIGMVWFMVYLVIAIPCWCQRGWCCCCFQCRFCKPRERIDEAKKFIMDNPPGVYHTSDDRRVTYEATNYEKYAHKKLEKALMKL